MTPRKIYLAILSGTLSLMVLSMAKCRLDMLVKPSVQVQPQLAVNPREIRDSARAGSDEERVAKIGIANSGHGKLGWSASEDKSWMRLSPRQGDAPDTLTLTMDSEDLPPATYRGTVMIVASGTEDSVVEVAVTFIVQRAGLTVTPSSITRGTNVNSGEVFQDNLQISNSGNGALAWTATKTKSWITLGAIAGTGPGTLPVTINSQGLAQGTYRDEIVITAPGAQGSPARIPVTLSIFAPGLAVTPSSVKDTANVGSTVPEPTTLRVTNSGTGAITWTATKTQPWLTFSKTAGGAPEDVTVSLDPTGLPLGTYTDEVVFTSPEATNGTVRVPVEFVITQPGLVVTPASIQDAATPNDPKKRDHELTVTNSGGATLGWFASSDRPWIEVRPLVGFTPTKLTVTLDPKDLGPGTHLGTVTVTSPGAAGSPFLVPVTLVIGSACNEIPIEPDVIRPGDLSPQDCDAPHRPGSFANVYGFTGNAGDVISIRLTATFNAFNPYLFLTDAAGNVLQQNDECPGETGTACIREFPVSATGRYLIEATSAAPGEQGQLTIRVVRELPPTPPQALGQFRLDGNTTIPVGGSTPEDAVIIKARINDPNLGDEVRLEVEVEPLGAPFANVPTDIGQFVPLSGGGVNVSLRVGGLANNTGYHWQARTCDRTNRCSTWLQFGDNAESAADFQVAVPPPGPTAPPETAGSKGEQP